MSSRLKLVPHPRTQPRGVRSVEVGVQAEPKRHSFLTFEVEPADTLILPNHGFGRADGLWRSTCFELFVKAPGQPGYSEFNFAPHSAWAAYSFSDWRKDMVQLDVAEPPHLVDCRLDDRNSNFPSRYELDVVLGADLLDSWPVEVGLAAVLKEEGGILSYWALAHPPGKPDFHHPACFAYKLPPAPRP